MHSVSELSFVVESLVFLGWLLMIILSFMYLNALLFKILLHRLRFQNCYLPAVRDALP